MFKASFPSNKDVRKKHPGWIYVISFLLKCHSYYVVMKRAARGSERFFWSLQSGAGGPVKKFCKAGQRHMGLLIQQRTVFVRQSWCRKISSILTFTVARSDEEVCCWAAMCPILFKTHTVGNGIWQLEIVKSAQWVFGNRYWWPSINDLKIFCY